MQLLQLQHGGADPDAAGARHDRRASSALRDGGAARRRATPTRSRPRTGSASGRATPATCTTGQRRRRAADATAPGASSSAACSATCTSPTTSLRDDYRRVDPARAPRRRARVLRRRDDAHHDYRRRRERPSTVPDHRGNAGPRAAAGSTARRSASCCCRSWSPRSRCSVRRGSGYHPYPGPRHHRVAHPRRRSSTCRSWGRTRASTGSTPGPRCSACSRSRTTSPEPRRVRSRSPRSSSTVPRCSATLLIARRRGGLPLLMVTGAVVLVLVRTAWRRSSRATCGTLT